jgi:hypothetical protein
MREFAVVLINSLEKMFFLAPKEILKNDARIKNIQQLSKSFSVSVPKNILPRRKVRPPSEVVENETIGH